MATGDNFVVDAGSIGGATSTTISVPSGAVWVVSSYYDSWQCDLRFNDGTNIGRIVNKGSSGNNQGDSMASRGIFDSSVEPSIHNDSCSSEDAGVMGREL